MASFFSGPRGRVWWLNASYCQVWVALTWPSLFCTSGNFPLLPILRIQSMPSSLDLANCWTAPSRFACSFVEFSRILAKRAWWCYPKESPWDHLSHFCSSPWWLWLSFSHSYSNQMSHDLSFGFVVSCMTTLCFAMGFNLQIMGLCKFGHHSFCMHPWDQILSHPSPSQLIYSFIYQILYTKFNTKRYERVFSEKTLTNNYSFSIERLR